MMNMIMLMMFVVKLTSLVSHDNDSGGRTRALRVLHLQADQVLREHLKA